MKILIIAAMVDVELDYLIENLNNKRIEECPVAKFYLGNIGNNDIVLCDSKVGLIKAASALTFAIEKYKPDYIINQGCAGGYGANVHKADIVIGTEIINITSFMTKKRNINEGCNIEDWELINYISGEADTLVPEKANENLVNKIRQIESKYTDGNIHYGVIGSGDIWNKEVDRIIYLNNKYKILCEEMEGISVYTVANMYNIPVVAIRVISNNEMLNEQYDRSISLNAQKFTLELLKILE